MKIRIEAASRPRSLDDRVKNANCKLSPLVGESVSEADERGKGEQKRKNRNKCEQKRKSKIIMSKSKKI